MANIDDVAEQDGGGKAKRELQWYFTEKKRDSDRYQTKLSVRLLPRVPFVKSTYRLALLN